MKRHFLTGATAMLLALVAGLDAQAAEDAGDIGADNQVGGDTAFSGHRDEDGAPIMVVAPTRKCSSEQMVSRLPLVLTNYMEA